MIALGLHGWEGTHDAAAALVVDGRLVACIEDERLSRRKHSLSDTPKLATDAVLAHAGLRWEDVDAVGYGWNLPVYSRAHGKVWPFSTDREFLARGLGFAAPRRLPVEWVNHHLTHAASAFHASGFERAAVLVVDGQGENRSISLYEAGSAGIRLLRDWGPPASLGLMYEAATLHCGFRFLDAGKTMGLAAYGRAPENRLPIDWGNEDILTPVPPDLIEDQVVRFWSRVLEQHFGPAVCPQTYSDTPTGSVAKLQDDPFRHCPEVAAAAQEAIERVLAGLIEYAQAKTGCSDVVLAGGVALNCVANGRIRRLCSRLFVPPYAHDAGAAVGAALLTARMAGDTIVNVPEPDLGRQFANADIERALTRHGLRARLTDDPASEAARLLLCGEVIGWFQGRDEVGPRALGRRSILALPFQAATIERINRIKGRERWRPLAPSALSDEMPWMFGEALESPYMLLSLTMTPEAQERIPAVSHVDGSSRVQTVPSNEAACYARLLRNLRKETGRGVVLNTSFNAGFEPIVGSPDDAIRGFSQMELGALVMGNYVLEKR